MALSIKQAQAREREQYEALARSENPVSRCIGRLMLEAGGPVRCWLSDERLRQTDVIEVVAALGYAAASWCASLGPDPELLETFVAMFSARMSECMQAIESGRAEEITESLGGRA